MSPPTVFTDHALAARAANFKTDTQHHCCDCVCCCASPVTEAAKILVDHCCACCDHVCTPEEHRAAISAARTKLYDALLCLEAYDRVV